MPLASVSLHNVRLYDLHTSELNEHVTLILGKNGSGKTSLLEAIYFLYRGTSFRGSDRDMIRTGATDATLKIENDDSSIRRATLRIDQDGKLIKEFTIDDKKSARLPTAARLPVVMFEPDELRLLTSSPSRRRDFIDGIITRLKPQYSTILSRYGRTLLQRNELLKQREFMDSHAWDAHLFAWDVKLAELAAIITKERRSLIDVCNEHLSRLYSALADSTHIISIEYGSPFRHDVYQQQLMDTLHASRRSDALRGFTSSGPHRDDFVTLLDKRAASETASRGEMRTIMLSFKLLEVELQEKVHDMPPLILMDDVFSELDASREQQLMNALQTYQTIITATDLRDALVPNATIIMFDQV